MVSIVTAHTPGRSAVKFSVTRMEGVSCSRGKAFDEKSSGQIFPLIREAMDWASECLKLL